MAIQNPERIQVRCRRCRQITWHEVTDQQKDSKYEYDDDGDICALLQEEYWQIIRCCGCQTFAFRTYEYAPWIETDAPNTLWGEQIFPEPVLQNHTLRRFQGLPPDVKRAYEDVVKASNSGLFLLAAMGVRMVIEGICKTKGFKGSLDKQINALLAERHLTSSQTSILHELRHQGNEAAHELFTPTEIQMEAYLLVLESILESLYELEIHKQALAAERKQRKAAKKYLT